MFKKETRKIIKMQLSELLVLVRGSGDMITCLPGIIGTDKIINLNPPDLIKTIKNNFWCSSNPSDIPSGILHFPLPISIHPHIGKRLLLYNINFFVLM